MYTLHWKYKPVSKILKDYDVEGRLDLKPGTNVKLALELVKRLNKIAGAGSHWVTNENNIILTEKDIPKWYDEILIAIKLYFQPIIKLYEKVASL